MVYEPNPVIFKESPSFENVLDTTFERLKEKHVQYSIRRIDEMEKELAAFEKELDEFIGGKTELS